MEYIAGAAMSAVAYLIVPDIMTPVETILFLWLGFIVSVAVIWWIQEQVEKVRRKRASLQIRKNSRRNKVIDFPVRGRVKHIPAFKVAK